MAISVVGVASAAGNTVALPAHQEGDLILGFSRWAGTGGNWPSRPNGWGTVGLLTGGADGLGLRTDYLYAGHSSHPAPVFASAVHVAVMVLRSTIGGTLRIGKSTQKNGTAVTWMEYGLLKFEIEDGSSMRVDVGTRVVATEAMTITPFGGTHRISQPSIPNTLLTVFTWPNAASNVGSTVGAGGTNSAFRTNSMEVIEVPSPGSPIWETTIDDFNRADGLINAGAGAALWQPTKIWDTASADLSIASNQLRGVSGDVYSSAWTKAQFKSDFDLIIDCAVVEHAGRLGLLAPLTNAGTTGYTSYSMNIYTLGGTAGTTDFSISLSDYLTRYINLPIALSAGCSIWFSKRGSKLAGHYRISAASPWRTMVEATDSTLNNIGPMGISINQGTTQRWDNLRGGPIYANEIVSVV